MKRILYFFILVTSIYLVINSFFLGQNILAQKFFETEETAIEEEEKKQKFFLKMQKLIDAAKKSGFSEKEIREITVVRNGKVLYVWDFLENEKLRLKKEKIAKKKAKPLDRYLSVMDISDELESGETKELDILKEKNVFVGAEQK